MKSLFYSSPRPFAWISEAVPSGEIYGELQLPVGNYLVGREYHAVGAKLFHPTSVVFLPTNPKQQNLNWIAWEAGRCPIPKAKAGSFALKLKAAATESPLSEVAFLEPKHSDAINFNWGIGTVIIAYALLESSND